MPKKSDNIIFCNREDEKNTTGVIVFCDQEKKFNNGAIMFCPNEDPDTPCDQLEPLAITQHDTLSTSLTYYVTGGKQPYTFYVENWLDVTNGPDYITIDDFLSNKPCESRSVAITVRDACGNTATSSSQYNAGGYALSISGTATLAVGNTFTVTGGTGPYTWYLSTYVVEYQGYETCGTLSISPDTTQATVTSIGGCCNENARITVTAGCGTKVLALTKPGTLTISGDEDVAVGEIYTGSGGIPPYSYSFDNGTIDSSGEIQTVDSCSNSGEPAMATVTVTDSCGDTASISVRLPDGQWVYQYEIRMVDECAAGCSAITSTYCYSGCTTRSSSFTGEIITGKDKIRESIAYVNFDEYNPTYGVCHCLGEPISDTITSGPCTFPPTPQTTWECAPWTIQPLVIKREYYEWQCP